MGNLFWTQAGTSDYTELTEPESSTAKQSVELQFIFAYIKSQMVPISPKLENLQQEHSTELISQNNTMLGTIKTLKHKLG